MDRFIGFKYRPINRRLFEVLESESIYFARPSDLNDPFDCQINVARSLRHAIQRSSGENLAILQRVEKRLAGLIASVQEIASEVGVWSCSVNGLNPVMWSHYANEHKGVCIAYMLPDRIITPDANTGFMGSSPVKYASQPLVEWFLGLTESSVPREAWDFAAAVMLILLESKPPAWAYEEEGRIISRRPGAVSVGTEPVVQVTFGLRVSDEDRSAVIRVLQNKGYKASMYNVVRTDEDYGLDLEELVV